MVMYEQPGPQREGTLPEFRSISGNISVDTLLFDHANHATPFLKDLLSTLPLKAHDSEVPLTGDGAGSILHAHIDELLQAAFFRPNEARFSYELAGEGDKPSQFQLDAFARLGMVDALTVASGRQYDLGAVFGGLLASVEARTRNMLDQGAVISSIALLGGQRPLIEREKGAALAAVIGQGFYQELERASALPVTEFQMMRCVWESFCRRDPSLQSIPVIEVDSQLRIGKIKEAPGTPETVVDLANTLMSGKGIPGMQAAPQTFLLSSSQPHAVRQREDFLSSMVKLGYPIHSDVDVVGYVSASPPSLKLYATELAKLVHAQLLVRQV